MAITFVTNALAAGNPTTSFSVALPTTQAGDILILEYTHRGSGTGTIGGTSVTSGGLTWTNKHTQLYASSAFSGHTYWTRATGNHATQTVTGSGLTDSCAAVVTVYRGALASGDPLADATIVGEQNASGNETQAQITTATDGAWVVLAVANSPDVAVTSCACTSPGALSNRAEKLSTGGTDTSIVHASAEKATAGATGAFTWAQTNGAGGSWAYAIKPASTDVSVALTGAASTVSAGSVDNEAEKPLTGHESTSAAGSITPDSSKAITGAEMASAAGDVVAEGETPDKTAALDGSEITSAAGDVVQSASKALEGLQSSSEAGSVTPEGGETLVALSGQEMTASAGSVGVSVPGGSQGGRRRAAPRRIIIRRVEDEEPDVIPHKRRALKPKKIEVDLRTPPQKPRTRIEPRKSEQFFIPPSLLKQIDQEDDDEWMLM